MENQNRKCKIFESPNLSWHNFSAISGFVNAPLNWISGRNSFVAFLQKSMLGWMLGSCYLCPSWQRLPRRPGPSLGRCPSRVPPSPPGRRLYPSARQRTSCSLSQGKVLKQTHTGLRRPLWHSPVLEYVIPDSKANVSCSQILIISFLVAFWVKPIRVPRLTWHTT